MEQEIAGFGRKAAMQHMVPAQDAGFRVRAATSSDLPSVIELDRDITGLAKPEYWNDLFDRYVNRGRNRFFFVAETDDALVGYIIGEVRAWEFGSPPCGWIFGVTVKPGTRLGRIGTTLFEAITTRFREAGVGKVRTMIARDNTLLMSFFRSQGMMAGPFIELEMDLDE